MKTLSHFRVFAALLFVLYIPGIVAAQNYDTSKTLTKTAAVPGKVLIRMSNQSGDLKITTTGENSASIKTTIEISGNSKEEVAQVIQAVENFEFNLAGNTLVIDTRFYKNMVSINNRKTMTLINGEKVKISEFKIRHELQIPKTAGLNLNNKYSDIELATLEGDAEFSLYSSNLHAADFLQDVVLEAKYSKIDMNIIGGKAAIDFYDTDIRFVSCGDASIKSKYSKFEAGKTGKLVIESYDDNFSITELSGLRMNAKYSDFVSQGNPADIHLDLYDCNIQVKSCIQGTYRGKYSDLKLGDIKELNVAETYDDNFFMGKTEKIQIGESKYSKFEIGEISSFFINGYDDLVSIGNLKPDFSEITMNGKYEKLNVEAGNIPFQVYFNIKYPKTEIPGSVKIIKQIKENSNLELVGNETGGKISVEGYDMKVVIND
jgi:hypothetical protein